MSLPIYDPLQVQLSRFIRDKVTNATDDGKIWTSAQRDNIMNLSIRRWIQMVVQRILAAEKANVVPVRHYERLSGYLNEEVQSMIANVLPLTTWTGSVDHIFTAYNVTKGQNVSPLPDDDFRFYSPSQGTFMGASSSNQYFVYDSSDFHLLDGATTTTDSIKLRYLKRHSNLVAGGGSTTVVSDVSCTLATTTVTSFTGVLSTHVGGTLVGLDAGVTPFSKTITSYVSSTSFTINSAPSGGDGTMTNCYIIPPYASSDILIPPQFHNEILDLAIAVAMEDQPTQERLARAQLKYTQVSQMMDA